jgi:hypothetical protein
MVAMGMEVLLVVPVVAMGVAKGAVMAVAAGWVR